MGTNFEEVGKRMKSDVQFWIFGVQPLTLEEENDDANWETRYDDGH